MTRHPLGCNRLPDGTWATWSTCTLAHDIEQRGRVTEPMPTEKSLSK